MANIAYDVHPIPPEIERAIADFGDGTAAAADATMGTPGWQAAMTLRNGARADLKVAIAKLTRDKARLDWLEQNAKKESGEDDGRAQIAVAWYDGSPKHGYMDAAFRVREWSDTPRDEDGDMDYSRRAYEQTDFPTMREAIDFAIGRPPLGEREAPSTSEAPATPRSEGRE